MEKVRMTVHEALCEVKTADKRIDKAIQEAKFLYVNRNSNTKIDGKDIDTVKSEIKSGYQKIRDLIRRTEAIKRAISLSNAQTLVTVSGKEMTVAEAIYSLQHGTDSKRQLLESMTKKYRDAQTSIELRNGSSLEERVDRFISSTFGSKDKANNEEIKLATETFMKQNSYSLIDPLNIVKEIEQLEEEISAFEVAVDSALQISNATTYIEFEY